MDLGSSFRVQVENVSQDSKREGRLTKVSEDSGRFGSDEGDLHQLGREGRLHLVHLLVGHEWFAVIVDHVGNDHDISVPFILSLKLSKSAQIFIVLFFLIIFWIIWLLIINYWLFFLSCLCILNTVCFIVWIHFSLLFCCWFFLLGLNFH